ncbi:hypothetical protein WDW89_11270 [Deltaproteobacteria bacterium TL4]
MGIYTNWIFPRLMEQAMSNGKMAKARQQLLKQVEGNILEIGFESVD